MKKRNTQLYLTLNWAGGSAWESHVLSRPEKIRQYDITIIMPHIKHIRILNSKIAGNHTKENNLRGAGFEKDTKQEGY